MLLGYMLGKARNSLPMLVYASGRIYIGRAIIDLKYLEGLVVGDEHLDSKPKIEKYLGCHLLVFMDTILHFVVFKQLDGFSNFL